MPLRQAVLTEICCAGDFRGKQSLQRTGAQVIAPKDSAPCNWFEVYCTRMALIALLIPACNQSGA
eukprot:8164-Heterococcus_DN1.PRE.4